MGQSTSLEVQSGPARPGPGGRNVFSNELDFLHDQIRKHSLTLRQLTTLTYDDLHSKIKELNDLSCKFVDCNGKQLVFEMKDGADAPVAAVLWKGLVRVRCIKINPSTNAVEKCRDLNLKQFLQVYNTMTQMQGTIESESVMGKNVEDEDSEKWDSSIGEAVGGAGACLKGSEDSDPDSTPVAVRKKPMFNMSASIILDEFGGALSPTMSSCEECCICMESKPEVSLPCAHSYCLACIEQWNVDHKTCPICREKLDTTDETWVLEDKPNSQEVTMEIRKSLFELTK